MISCNSLDIFAKQDIMLTEGVLIGNITLMYRRLISYRPKMIFSREKWSGIAPS